MGMKSIDGASSMVIVISKEKAPARKLHGAGNDCVHAMVFSVKPSWKYLRLGVFVHFCTAN